MGELENKYKEYGIDWCSNYLEMTMEEAMGKIFEAEFQMNAKRIFGNYETYVIVQFNSVCGRIVVREPNLFFSKMKGESYVSEIPEYFLKDIELKLRADGQGFIAFLDRDKVLETTYQENVKTIRYLNKLIPGYQLKRSFDEEKTNSELTFLLKDLILSEFNFKDEEIKQNFFQPFFKKAVSLHRI